MSLSFGTFQKVFCRLRESPKPIDEVVFKNAKLFFFAQFVELGIALKSLGHTVDVIFRKAELKVGIHHRVPGKDFFLGDLILV